MYASRPFIRYHFAGTEGNVVSRRSFIGSAAAMAVSTKTTTAGTTPAAPNFGKMLIAGFRGIQESDPEVAQVLQYLSQSEISGVLLLRRNITSPEQLYYLTESFREAANSFTPIIAIDQEGGAVARLGEQNGFLDWSSAQNMAESGLTGEQLLDYYRVRVAQLASSGVNTNFAPVVDLNVNPTNPIIGGLGRSFGNKTEDVVKAAVEFVKAHKLAGVRTCLKHFPGHGSSNSDSHLGFVDISESWTEQELGPYLELNNRDMVEAIMVGHLVNAQVSKESEVPLSLWGGLRHYLEELLGFTGPVFTDDMQMGAVSEYTSRREAAAMAVNAGNTFLVYSNFRDDQPIETISEVRQELEDDFLAGNLHEEVVFKSLEVADNHVLTLF